MTISPQLRTTITYVVISAIWIWLSDLVLDALVHNPRHLTSLQSAKGWLFVLATGVMLYGMIGHTVHRMSAVNRKLLEGNEQSLRVLVSAMDARHKETGDHSSRVMRVTEGMARLVGLEGKALRDLRFGALLHDIGKLALPDAILIKPGKLDADEIAVMRTHPRIGRDMLLQVDFLRDAVDIPYCHHERWDGEGYPQGLRGEAIPLAARIFSVVDVWDALSSARVYKPAWPEDEVLDHLRSVAGQQLDPQLVELFLGHYDELKALA
ncbi:HD-GYP domain-containing protein [Dyella sp. A6]|uniref:HD-GYP domain-containing protein n=1 Tax=Dyella aluminiiresistens TaxID=3069105 RepID=UPI002E7A8A7B|nr:HD domain-containing phosphohydrolase [Dyella sp. A6]